MWAAVEGGWGAPANQDTEATHPVRFDAARLAMTFPPANATLAIRPDYQLGK